jgi:serine/threonine-protein kinase
VYVARDEELKREVALKEIQNRLADDPASRARFLLEAEVTGGLEHPGIVPVYGLGTYADGRPFYAMRFIRGDSLQDAIERFHRAGLGGPDAGERGVAFRQLLRRFVDVCNAIQYAHDRGVLHRDLKPGNVMLGQYGETLVVDWGLAKPRGAAEPTATGEPPLQPSSGSGSAPTEMGKALGTPAYMSPEQAAGRLDLLGPATDVYSLGATLYHLLTGRPPVDSGDVGEVLQRVQRGEIPRPRQVKKEVPAALEAVCLKALALRPRDRYPSARALVDDVEHWLADEPVSAWREPWRVRARRWLGRHRTLVAATATATAVTVVALATATVLLTAANEAERRARGLAQEKEGQANRLARQEELARRDAQKQRDEARKQKQAAEAQRGLAREEADRSRQVTRFLVGLFEASDPLGLNGFVGGLVNRTGEDLTARELLARAVKAIALDPKTKPRVRADILDAVGTVYRSQGRHAEAEKLLEEALELRRGAKAPPGELASSLHSLAWLNHERGDYRTAVKLYREALRLRLGEPVRDEAAVTNSQLNLGWVLTEMEQYEDAEKLLLEVVARRQKLYGPGTARRRSPRWPSCPSFWRRAST